MITVTVNDQGTISSLNRLAGLMGDLTPVMVEIGETLRDASLEAFRAQRSPEGVPWRALSPATIARRRKEGRGARILQDTGVLRNSITTQLLSSNAVAIGSRVRYAAIHQLGGRAGRNLAARIPARPFLGVSPEAAQEIENTVTRAIASALTTGGTAP